MHYLTGTIMVAGDICWNVGQSRATHREEGLTISFPLTGRVPQREAVRLVGDRVRENQVRWLTTAGRQWSIDFDRLRPEVGEPFRELNWLVGKWDFTPVVDYEEREVFDETRVETVVSIQVYKEEFLMDRQQRIFLSHKGADKPLVRGFSNALRAAGFDPWLDEDAMPAGVELHRGILEGLQESCAAVFFITPAFRDEQYLRNEINYAVDEKRKKGDRFAIITLSLADAAGNRGQVPDLLRPYVWKEPAKEIDAFYEIVRALPIQVGPPTWR